MCYSPDNNRQLGIGGRSGESAISFSSRGSSWRSRVAVTPSAATAREQVLSACAVLEYSEEAQILAAKIVSTHLLPAKAAVDAAHIAIATVHQMDFLLTWNCRHIANAAIVEDVRAVCAKAGHPAPVICTPLELMV